MIETFIYLLLLSACTDNNQENMEYKEIKYYQGISTIKLSNKKYIIQLENGEKLNVHNWNDKEYNYYKKNDLSVISHLFIYNDLINDGMKTCIILHMEEKIIKPPFDIFSKIQEMRSLNV